MKGEGIVGGGVLFAVEVSDDGGVDVDWSLATVTITRDVFLIVLLTIAALALESILLRVSGCVVCLICKITT